MLDSNKSKKILKWKAQYNLEQSINLTSIWFKKFMDKENQDILLVTQDQIRDYLNL